MCFRLEFEESCGVLKAESYTFLQSDSSFHRDSDPLLCTQFVSDGIFKAELNEFLTRELAEDGYSGVEVRVTPTRTEIIILATR